MDPATEPKPRSTKSSTAFCNPKRGLGAPPARGQAADSGGPEAEAQGCRGRWLARTEPYKHGDTHFLPVFKLTEKQTPT